jgi:hypothetical protein
MRSLAPFSSFAVLAALQSLCYADPLPPDSTYRPLPTLPFETVKANDEAAKPKVLQRQHALLVERYDLRTSRFPV